MRICESTVSSKVLLILVHRILNPSDVGVAYPEKPHLTPHFDNYRPGVFGNPL